MKCPACSRELSRLTVGTLTVDVCRGGCGGIWFDQLELTRVDEQEETAGEALLDIESDPLVKVNKKARRRCPRCPGIIMMRYFYGPKRQVEIDECASCGGIWLDAGELAAIRSEYRTQAERHQAAQAFADSLLRKKLGGANADLALPVSSVLRFLWPKS